jgi:hypothetical protein
MIANYLPQERCFVTASDLSESRDERKCPFCGKRFDEDGRARAAYLRHVADCKQSYEGQATLEAYGAVCPSGEATDGQVRRAIEALEDDA